MPFRDRDSSNSFWETITNLGDLVKSEEHFNESLISNTHIMAYFMASWCAPCKIISGYLVPDEFKKKGVKGAIINIDNPELLPLIERYKLRGAPTIMLFEGEELRKKVEGMHPPDKLYGSLKVGLYSENNSKTFF